MKKLSLDYQTNSLFGIFCAKSLGSAMYRQVNVVYNR